MKKHDELAGYTAVVLVNTGTPEAPTPHAVRKYLSQFLMDPRIRPMGIVPWWCILHMGILPKRGKASAQKYAGIWTEEGSPLVATQAKLAKGLQDAFAAQGLPIVVRSAMNYGQPSVGKVVKGLKKQGVERIVALPLYPQAAFSTTGSAKDHLANAVRKSHFKGDVTVVESYCDSPMYQKAIAAAIRNAGFDPDSDDQLLFSFHSVPLNDLEAGDNYELQAGSSSLGIANQLGLDRRRWTIGYQCQFDKGRQWLTPFSRDILAGRAENNQGERIFIVCPNFAIDCLETIYDVQQHFIPEYLAAKRDFDLYGQRRDNDGAQSCIGAIGESEDIVYVPCLNATKAHVKVLAKVLEPYLQ